MPKYQLVDVRKTLTGSDCEAGVYVQDETATVTDDPTPIQLDIENRLVTSIQLKLGLEYKVGAVDFENNCIGVPYVAVQKRDKGKLSDADLKRIKDLVSPVFTQRKHEKSAPSSVMFQPASTRPSVAVHQTEKKHRSRAAI
jgi:hypothetical protein